MIYSYPKFSIQKNFGKTSKSFFGGNNYLKL